MTGSLALIIALIFCTLGVFIPIVSIALDRDYLEYVCWAAYAVAGLMTTAVVILVINLLSSNFQYVYVTDYTNRALGTIYKISALYAGQGGSLLFWGWLIAIFTAMVAFKYRKEVSDYFAYVMSILFVVVWVFIYFISLGPWFQVVKELPKSASSSNSSALISLGTASFLNFLLIIAIVGVIAWTIVMSLQKRDKKESFAWVIYCGTVLAMLLFLIRLGIINNIYMGTNPFELLPPGARIPADGQGLNPLLQNYGMIFHPPTLFLGWAGLAVPFAFALAALLTNRFDNEWLQRSRKWIIFSWLLLGVGIILGSQWAYMELGWGGYWAWDPVENSSLMPWLIGTALMHSTLAQRRKNMFKVWNIVLVTIAFILGIYGTYITRSGVISSVHSFGKNPLGNFILTFIVVALIGSIALITVKYKKLISERHVENFISKEFTFLATNLLFLIGFVIVFYGTDYSLIVYWITIIARKAGIVLSPAFLAKKELGKQFYETLMGPVGLIGFTLMIFCPLLSWRRMSEENIKKKLYIPAGIIGGLAVLIFPLYAAGKITSPLSWFGLGMLALLIYVCGQEIFKSFRGKKRFNWDRIGAYITHLGVAVAFIGIIISSAFTYTKTTTLEVQKSVKFAGYTFQYEGPESTDDALKTSYIANVSVWDGSKQLALLRPSQDAYKSVNEGQGQNSTEPGLYFNLKEDVYIILNNFVDNYGNKVSLKMMYNPAVIWFWIGSIVMAIGGLVILYSSYMPASIQLKRKKIPSQFGETAETVEYVEGMDDIEEEEEEAEDEDEYEDYFEYDETEEDEEDEEDEGYDEDDDLEDDDEEDETKEDEEDDDFEEEDYDEEDDDDIEEDDDEDSYDSSAENDEYEDDDFEDDDEEDYDEDTEEESKDADKQKKY